MSEKRWPDPRLEVLARRVEVLLYLVIPVFLYQAVTGGGIERILFGTSAVGLTLILLLHRFVGVPGHTLLRWVAGVAGAVFLVGGVGLLGVGIWFMTLGSFAILMGMMAVPLSVGLGAWGYTLLASALADPGRRRSLAVDLDAARRSEAVRRFDALHRPPGAPPPPSDPGDVDAGAS